jgi:hypothetical protein
MAARMAVAENAAGFEAVTAYHLRDRAALLRQRMASPTL